MKHVRTALAGAVAVAFTQLALAQSSEGSADPQSNPAYGAQQEQQYEPRSQQNARDRDGDRRPSVRGDDDPPRGDWRYPGKPGGDN